MKFVFNVYHDHVAAAREIEGLMYPLDAQREEHEYSCFPGTLAHRFRGDGMIASSEPRSGHKGMVVTIETSRPLPEVKNALAQVLIAQNKAINGLCLIAIDAKC